MECVCLAVLARDRLGPSPLLAWRVRRPCSYRCRRRGAFSCWDRFVPERCPETVRRAAYWGDGSRRCAIAVVASSATCCCVADVGFFFLSPEVAFALAAEFSEAACGGGRILGNAWGSVVATGGPAIGKCPRSRRVRVLRRIPATSTCTPVVRRGGFVVPR